MITLILLAQFFPCECSQPPSSVVVDQDGHCLYWFYNDESEKHNPCINVPGNALPIWVKDDNTTNEKT
jgi:hypothetical protein